MSSFYRHSINRVVDHIQANLDADLSVKKLSAIACFSEFHFNRIFKTVMGEPVYRFIRRLRLEKAAELLLASPGKSITDIAFTCGFSTPSAFAKSFKACFKMSATDWRNSATPFFDENSASSRAEHGKLSIVDGQEVWSFYNDNSVRRVVVEDIGPVTIAYIRHVGDYQGDETLFGRLYGRLFQWAAAHGCIDETTVPLNVYHDIPKITEKQKLRLMVAIPVKSSVNPSGSVGVTKLPGGKYGSCRFLLKQDA